MPEPTAPAPDTAPASPPATAPAPAWSPAARAALAWAAALACGGTLWLVALWSVAGGDWFITETHAHVLYSAILRDGEFPYFTFHLNQGAYLLQDPQFPGLSVSTPLILALGPEGGTRAAALVFGVAGWWFAYLWLRRRVPSAAAAFAAAAWTLSLGILWRIAVGNDFFVWFLVLPLLLHLAEEATLRPSVRSAAGLGLAVGTCVLGPTFHAVVYLIAPACLAWVAVLLATGLARRTLPARAPLALGLALLTALAVAAPRLLAWSALSMRRPVEADGTMALGLALESLFSATKTSPLEMLPVVGAASAGGIAYPTYAIWESSAALPPIASLLALLALALPAVRRSRAALLALLLVAAGLCLATCPWAWGAVRRVAPFLRISRRFLILSGFGLAVLAAFGFAEVARRAGRWALAWHAAAFLAVAGSTAAWIAGSMRDGRLAPGATPAITHPPPRSGDAPHAVPYLGPEQIADGHVLAGRFHSVGNPCAGIIRGGVWCSDYAERLLATPFGRGEPLPIVAGGRAPVTLRHTSIEIGPLGPGEGVALNVLARPLLGYEVEPAGSPVRLLGADEHLAVVNPGPTAQPWTRIVARSPVPGWLWYPWGALVLGLAAALAAGPAGRAAAAWRRSWGRPHRPS